VSRSNYDLRAMDIAGELAELPAEERLRRLDELCAGDDALRARVRAMLDELHESTAPRDQEPTARAAVEPDVHTPIASIGPYRLIRRIGAGGMSEVYEAEQERPRRRVALKLIHPLRITPAMLRRFEFEVEVLGRLEHPGIARVYDAGTAQTRFGTQPWFAMELVRGQRLDHWLRAARPDLERRLRMLIDICDAVQHAHQHGVIHRDLKPANILVTDDGKPKVLDFGVAGAVEGSAAGSSAGGETLHTATGQIVGTLQYMSPEQAAGDVRRLDTRSDVYALGVIAYQLLSDRLPYDVSDKPLPEAVRVICDEEPTRLSTIDRSLRGDLETIVFKAMAKEKQQRYTGCGELAADLRRYLDYEPISARPPSPWYQAAKFARRHKTLVSAAISIFAVLVIGVIVSTAAMLEAHRARRYAVQRQRDAEAARAATEQINTFLNDMLASVDPIRAQGNEPTVREVLERASAQIAGRFEDQPLVEADLRNTIGETYQSLGLYAQAREQATRALELRRRALGPDHQLALDSQNAIALASEAMGDLASAERTYRELLDTSRRVLGADHPDTLMGLNNLACNLDDQGRTAEAQPLHREALALRRRRLGDDHAHTIQSVHNLGTSLLMSGKLDDALPLLREGVQRRARTLGPDHPSTLASVTSLADTLCDTGQAAEAEPMLRDALARCERVLGPEHANTIVVMGRWAKSLRLIGRYDQAEPAIAEALARARRSIAADDDHPRVLPLLNERASILFHMGRIAESEAAFRDLLPRLHRVLGADHPGSAIVQGNYALALAKLERFAEAEPVFRDLFARIDSAPVPRSRAAAFAAEYARCLRELGRSDEANALSMKYPASQPGN
jgi:serine/threonine protein kinase/tetratricopeptide (TPR) repeat protein